MVAGGESLVTDRGRPHRQDRSGTDAAHAPSIDSRGRRHTGRQTSAPDLSSQRRSRSVPSLRTNAVDRVLRHFGRRAVSSQPGRLQGASRQPRRRLPGPPPGLTRRVEPHRGGRLRGFVHQPDHPYARPTAPSAPPRMPLCPYPPGRPRPAARLDPAGPDQRRLLAQPGGLPAHRGPGAAAWVADRAERCRRPVLSSQDADARRSHA